MTITKRTIVDQVEVVRSRAVQVRLALEIVEDDVVLSQAWHRFLLDRETDLDAMIQDVNTDIAGRGYPQIAAGDEALVAALSTVAWAG